MHGVHHGLAAVAHGVDVPTSCRGSVLGREDDSVAIPYGTANAGIDRETFRAAFAANLVILLGTADSDPNSGPTFETFCRYQT